MPGRFFIVLGRYTCTVESPNWIDWGSAPAWVAALGTVGTLAFTLLLLRREIRDRRTEQARLVNAWATWSCHYPRDGDPVVEVRRGRAEQFHAACLLGEGGRVAVGLGPRPARRRDCRRTRRNSRHN